MGGPTGGHHISVIVPVYRAAFLEEAVRSVCCQRRRPDEIIVVDDGSPDREILSRVRRTYGHRLIIVEQSNTGAGAARNAGLRAAAGDLIAFLDADDVWAADALERQVGFLDREHADVVYADGRLIDEEGRPLGRFAERAPSCGAVTLEALLAQQCNVLMSTVLARRELILRVGLFDESLRRGQDFDLWIRLAHGGARFAYHRAVVVTRRIHDHNLSGSRTAELTRAATVLAKTARTLDLRPAERTALERQQRALAAEMQRELGKALLLQRHYEEARECLAAVRAVAPGWKLEAALLALRFTPGLLRRIVHLRTGGPRVLAAKAGTAE